MNKPLKAAEAPVPTGYDAVPYPSDAFPQTDPRRLACIARLFGLDPAKTANARILELGCAGGGNLLPLAARLPGATLTGIDASSRQIAEAQRLAEACGLKNVTLAYGDILQIGPELGQFDYIICHGVYSWVPAPVQDAILKVCAQNLAENGIAYISYNTYPGWKTREIVRDAMLFHTRDDPYDLAKLSRGRGMLEFMQNTNAFGEIFGKLFQQQREFVAGATPAYVMHDFLEPNNSPCYFHEFNTRAGAHDLTYLTDADTFTTFSENYGAAAREALIAETGGNQTMIEQYLDFCSNRSFRQSLLIKSGQAGKIKRQIDTQALMQMHLRGMFVNIAGDRADEAAALTMTTRRGANVHAAPPFVKAALLALCDAQPATLSFPQWLAATDKALGEHESHKTMLLELTTRMVIAGHVDLVDEAIAPGAGNVEMPKADPFLQHQSAGGAYSLASMHHETIRLDVVETALLPRLDGASSHADLLAHLLQSVKDGQIVFQREGKPLEDAASIETAAREHLAASLRSLHAKSALV